MKNGLTPCYDKQHDEGNQDKCHDELSVMVVPAAVTAIIPTAIAAVITTVIVVIVISLLYCLVLIIHNLSFPNICGLCHIWILSDIRQYLLYYIENQTQKQYAVHELWCDF